MWRYVKLWAELLRLTGRHCPGATAGLVAVKAASVGTPVAVALALRAAVDAIAAREPAAAGVAATCVGLAFAAGVLLHGLDMMLHFMIVDRIGVLHLQHQINRDIATLDGLDHLERTDFLDRITVLRGAAWGLTFNAWAAVAAIADIVKIAALLTLLGAVSPWLLFLLLAAGAPLWFEYRSQETVSRAEIHTAEAFRLQRHLFDLATSPAGGKEIRVAGAGDELARRQSEAWNEVVHGRFTAQLRAGLWKVLGWTLFTLGFAGGLVLVVYRAAHGQAALGDLVLSITVAVSLRESIGQAVFGVTDLAGGARLIEPYLWLRAYVATERGRNQGGRPVPAALREGITLDRVSYRYPGSERPALNEVSCHLPAGSVVAVVGEYGSGKTTLVKLLSKLYGLDSGRILVDGTDLAQIATEAWRGRCSAAFQDFGRFQVRIADTIGLGDLAHLDDRDRIGAAVVAADAEALIARLPNGLDTQLGRKFDGVELSEGQWQKTALARASMRPEPLLFLLDEPTASLDAPSEHAIFQRYMVRAREIAGRTGAITVIVSHRFSTVTGADQILVFDQGCLVECGSHGELLALGGRYAGLYGIQATAYAAG